MVITADWVNAIAQVFAATGTISAVLIILFGALRNRPKLSISLQREDGSGKAFWHESSLSPSSGGGFSSSVLIYQLRVWVANDGRKQAKNCRVKLTVTDGGDGSSVNSTRLVEFTLPVFLYFKPQIDETTGLLAPPEPGEMSVDVPAHSKEAFELLFHRVGLGAVCYPYSRTSFPLNPNTKYLLRLRAYADETIPSAEVSYPFEWDGSPDGLPSAIRGS